MWLVSKGKMLHCVFITPKFITISYGLVSIIRITTFRICIIHPVSYQVSGNPLTCAIYRYPDRVGNIRAYVWNLEKLNKDSLHTTLLSSLQSRSDK